MLVSISAGPNAGVYASPDLLGWTRILNGSHRISSLDDGQAVALPETPTGQAQLIRDSSVSPLQLSVPALRMAGRLAPGKTLVADAGNATTTSTTAAATWQTARAAPICERCRLTRRRRRDCRRFQERHFPLARWWDVMVACARIAGAGTSRQQRDHGGHFFRRSTRCGRERGHVDMAILLGAKQVVRCVVVLLAALGAIGALTVSSPADVLASNQTGNWTGYAYGNCCGGGGSIDQGTFANHLQGDCPGDPAAGWPWNSSIIMVSPPRLNVYDGNGNPSFAGSFVLRDIGDRTCSEGNYWVDIYYGRHANSAEYNAGCSCPGVPVPGVCDLASHSNCQDAMNWGVQGVNYNGP
jgi:hypothetical protein